MTETQITFADINVGDKIRSVSPCGTERVGVVAQMRSGYALNGESRGFVWNTDTIYRIAPAFTPLPIPNEGQWIRATLRGGKVVEGAVNSLLDRTSPTSFRAWLVEIEKETYFINADPRAANSPYDIIAWEPIDPPAPPEPDWFGYVGYVTTPEGDVWDVMRDGEGDCAAIRRSDGRYKTLPWPAILALGTFTAVKP